LSAKEFGCIASDMRNWIAARLGRKFTFFLAVELLTASLIFLALFLWLYSHQLEKERGQASAQVNALLQVALENAMLKRDLDGLRDIIYYLGRQQNIRRVTIINPDGQVRFSSLPETVNDQMPVTAGDLGAVRTRFLVDEFGREVLRSTNPVHNREPCSRCHGPVADHPVNGILIVDYDAANIRQAAERGAFLLIGSGGLVVVLVMLGVWLGLKQHVLRPVWLLRKAALRFGKGDLDSRAGLAGLDELSDLGRSFDSMASNLKDSMETVRRQEAFLQTVIDTVPDGIRVIDQDFRIVKANRIYCEQVGASKDKVVGSMCYASSHGRTERCPSTYVTCPLVEVFCDRKPLKCMHRHKGADGLEFPVEVHAAPLELADGRLLVIEAIRNLSADIRFSHEQKLSALGQLAAGVAHEIRNPLASVRLALQGSLRLAEQGDVDAGMMSNYLRLVDGQIDKCIDVTDRLLRLSANTSAAERQLVSVNTVITETLSLLGWEAKAANVDVVTELDTEEPRVIANDGELRMVVLNLVQNAFHAMPNGGRLVISCRAVQGQIHLNFRDDGVGISAENLPKIFDPFFSQRANGGQGTGLGLTICRSILDSMAGEISVRSNLGGGTRFTVILPAAEGGLA